MLIVDDHLPGYGLSSSYNPTFYISIINSVPVYCLPSCEVTIIHRVKYILMYSHYLLKRYLPFNWKGNYELRKTGSINPYIFSLGIFIGTCCSYHLRTEGKIQQFLIGNAHFLVGCATELSYFCFFIVGWNCYVKSVRVSKEKRRTKMRMTNPIWKLRWRVSMELGGMLSKLFKLFCNLVVKAGEVSSASVLQYWCFIIRRNVSSLSLNCLSIAGKGPR